MNGKRKGSGFERLVAKELSLYLTGGASKTELIRSVLSGGWSPGQQEGEGWRQVGDLAPNGPVGEQFRSRYAVECKHQRKISLYDFWTKSSKDSLPGWWAKLVKDSLEARVKPMLIFRSNAMPIMVGMHDEDVPMGIVSSEAVYAKITPFNITVFKFEDLKKHVNAGTFLLALTTPADEGMNPAPNGYR